MGDFNASNTLWGSSKTDNRGHMIEEVTLDENTIILNDGSKTNLSLAHGTFNSVDLTLTVPYLGPRFLWELLAHLQVVKSGLKMQLTGLFLSV
uniref:Endonuclease/exonuclease/phosphatase domain-containing protein n=1 Tax=Phlebotomus papatasi TaxID=29031 RepID=A0A1B0GQ11_PHLPP